jgi:hypothetical protein
VCRFLGSIAIGILQDLSVPAAIILRQVKKEFHRQLTSNAWIPYHANRIR